MENFDKDAEVLNVDDMKIDRSFRHRIFNNQIFRALRKIKKFLFLRS